MIKNYYGNLCTEMYEILHKEAPQDELEFYLSYAEKGMSILEPMCGSGRFLVPFLERGYNIKGIDASKEMLSKLKEKVPTAQVFQGDILNFDEKEKYDYIFISSGSVSLFTDMELCKKVLQKMKNLLTKKGKFVFAVDTVANKCLDDLDYKVSISVKTKEGFDFSIYELYNESKLLQQELMDFQTHLYELGEIEAYLHTIGFTKVIVYASYEKAIAKNNQTEMFLYECSF